MKKRSGRHGFGSMSQQQQQPYGSERRHPQRGNRRSEYGYSEDYEKRNRGYDEDDYDRDYDIEDYYDEDDYFDEDEGYEDHDVENYNDHREFDKYDDDLDSDEDDDEYGNNRRYQRNEGRGYSSMDNRELRRGDYRRMHSFGVGDDEGSYGYNQGYSNRDQRSYGLNQRSQRRGQESYGRNQRSSGRGQRSNQRNQSSYGFDEDNYGYHQGLSGHQRSQGRDDYDNQQSSLRNGWPMSQSNSRRSERRGFASNQNEYDSNRYANTDDYDIDYSGRGEYSQDSNFSNRNSNGSPRRHSASWRDSDRVNENRGNSHHTGDAYNRDGGRGYYSKRGTASHSRSYSRTI